MYIPLLSQRRMEFIPRVERRDTDASQAQARDAVLVQPLDAIERRAPAGGGGGRGSSSSSSSSSSGKSSGSSSSSGKSAPKSVSGSSSSSRVPLTKLPGASSRVNPSTSSTTSRDLIYGAGGYTAGSAIGSYSYGYGRPYYGSPAPLYGFWPYYWQTDDYDPTHPSGDQRPGGSLTSLGVQLPNNQSRVYVLYGDAFSVDAVLGPVLAQTGAQNATLPADISNNATIEQYRSQSFLLLSLNTSSAPDANTSFIAALNQTIGQNLPISGAPKLPVHFWLGSALTVAAGAALAL